MTSLSQNRHRAFGPLAEQFNDLLRRYPNVDHDEVEQMIAIYPKLTILEVGLLSSDERLGKSLHEFSRAHRERLRPSWHDHFLLAMVMLATFALFAALVWGVMA
ncbi:MAG: hypothetical protein EOP61_00310 [Sphingomonadales bacterium]|nr:MAG: hypothetical protein EOP61_00310 [Sphingomonadales bacterium]